MDKIETRTVEKGVARSAARGQLGMTLVEIMIVLAIIALVMGVLVGPRVLEALSQSKEKIAKMIAKDYIQAYTRWAADNPEDSCPESLESLRKYRDKKDDKDPWGSRWVMKCGDTGQEGTMFGVVSPGPDKKENTQDDIRSWEL